MSALCGISIVDLDVSRTSYCVRLKTRHSVRAWRLIEKRRGREGKERGGRRRRGSDRGRERGRKDKEKRWDMHHILYQQLL